MRSQIYKGYVEWGRPREANQSLEEGAKTHNKSQHRHTNNKQSKTRQSQRKSHNSHFRVVEKRGAMLHPLATLSEK